ncbi:MAG TPA: hypothetical protein VGO59_07185 [Verrucomicrobiae bacterium]
MTTLEYNGVEKALADWGIAQASREVSNQAHDHFACDIIVPFDSADPIPYDSQITLRIGRVSAVTPSATGLPVAGVTSWSGGSTWFIGWRVEEFRNGSGTAESLQFKFAGPWEHFFERLVFQKLWWTWNGTENVADWRSQVVLGQSANALVGVNDTVPGTNATNLMSIRQQVAEIIGYCAGQTALEYGSPQFQSDGLTHDTSGNYNLLATPGTNLLIPDYIAGVYEVAGKTSATADLQTVLRAPLDSVNDITCAEALRRMLRWIGPMGGPVVWFDYTTSPPTLKIGTRDVLPSVTLPATGQTESLKIQRRDDLIPQFVALKYRITGQVDSGVYTEIINDIAGEVGGSVIEGVGLTGALYSIESFAGGSPALLSSGQITALQNGSRFRAVPCATVDFEGSSSTSTSCTISTINADFNQPDLGGDAAACWAALFPELKEVANPVFTFPTSPTVVDDSGAAVNTSVYKYLLLDSQIAPWMLAGNAPGGVAASAKQCTVTVNFTGTASSQGVQAEHFLNHEKTARCTLITVPGGTYKTQTDTPGEVVPYGLAGYIYNIESIPQYEGTFTIQETEVTDPCPLGNNLNLSGSLSEWANMGASVQQISYDLAAGRTTLVFGPAAHLGAKDFVERLRVNRGPRWANLNGTNITNDPGQQRGTQLGNSVAQRGPSPGARMLDWHHYPADIADESDPANAAIYSAIGGPGFHVDTRASAQPQYGNNGGAISAAGLSSPNTPGFFAAYGAGGTLTTCIRCFTGDLPAGAQAFWQEVNLTLADGTCTTMWVLGALNPP